MIDSNIPAPLPPNSNANTSATQQPSTNDAGTNDSAGNGDKTPLPVTPPAKKEKPDGITPEIQAYIDTQSRLARLGGETKGKTIKEEEIENAKADAQKQADLEAGRHKELYDSEVSTHNATKQSLTSAQAELDKLRASLAGQVPNPLDNYKRIVGESYDDMVEDAKKLAASFGNNAHRDANAPPLVPNVPDGGKFEQNNNNSVKTTSDDLDRNRPKYNVF